MIYEFPDEDDSIRQGDIFVGLPRFDISLDSIPVVREGSDAVRVQRWEDLSAETEPLSAVVAMRSVAAIVATQDCDTLRSPDITLCEIRDFQDVEKKSSSTTKPKSWKNIITQHARINQKWFYLPPDKAMEFDSKKAVDFLVTLRIARKDLERLRHLRKGRLNTVADEHFRERISEFFRRYPYDEWYSLSADELEAYRSEYPDTKAFPWQS